MQGSLDAPPITVRTSRRLSSIGVLICGAILYLNLASLVRAGWPGHMQSYFGLYLFGLGFAYFGWQLIDPMVLTLAPEGLTWSNTWVSRHWSWNEISNFRVTIFGMIGCDLSSKNPATGWLRPINKKIVGSQGALGFGWEMGARRLVEILNNARSHWLNRT